MKRVAKTEQKVLAKIDREKITLAPKHVRKAEHSVAHLPRCKKRVQFFCSTFVKGVNLLCETVRA